MTDIDKDSKKENDKSVIECIQALYKSIENKAYSQELKDLFFRQVQNRDHLPENTSDDIIIKFIECLIYIAFSDSDEQLSFKAVQILFRFLKTDVQVFMCFRPNKLTIRKLKLDKYLLNATHENMESILDFCCFLLRYFETIDYDDFSDLSTINNKIKRAEIHRIWIDMEDILSRMDSAEQTIKQNMSNTAAGFGEVFAYIDKINKNISGHQNETQEKLAYLYKQLEMNRGEHERQNSDRNDKESKQELQINMLMKKIENLEKKVNEKNVMQGLGLNDSLDHSKSHGSLDKSIPNQQSQTQGQPFLNNDDDFAKTVDKSNPGNLLYIKEIYDRLEETKKQLSMKISKLDSDLTLYKTSRPSDESITDNLLRSVNQIVNRVEALERDKKKTPDFNFLQKVEKYEDDFESIKVRINNIEDLKDNFDFHDRKLDSLTEELTTIKDYLKKNGPDNEQYEVTNMQMERMKKEISFEVEKLGTFIQEFVNEQAKIKIKRIKRIDISVKDKMDEYEWFVRNIEFISPSIPADLLQWTKETLADTDNNPNKVMLTTNKHDSDVILTLIQLIKECEETSSQSIRQLLDQYLLFVEVLLMSDPNLDKALLTDIYDRLFAVIMGDEQYTLEEKKNSLRCISACLRKDNAILQLVKSKLYMGVMIEIFKKPWDEEAIIILTNFFRIAFIFHADMNVSELSLVEIQKTLFKNVKVYSYSEVLVEDTLLAIHNFAKKEENLDLIDDPKCYDPIIDLALKSSSKLKGYAVNILRNSKKKASLGGYFARQGYSELI